MKKVGVLRRIRAALDTPVLGQRHPGDQRGMALLLALVLIVMITAFVAEFNYSARVKILSASHARDDTKAYYLAKSGIRTYGLVLVVGRQMTGQRMVLDMLASVGLSLDGAGMVCRSIPFLDTAMLRFLTGAGSSLDDEQREGIAGFMNDDGVEATDAEGNQLRGSTEEGEDVPSLRRGLLEFEGDFKVECFDDSSKIDLNGFANPAWVGLPIQQHPVGQLLFGLLAPPEYDPLFEERLKIERWELIGNIKDWVDPDSERSGFWGGDEDGLYDGYDPRYRAKNAKFDSVAEVRMVEGVTDEVWESFGDAFSIHSQSNGSAKYKINVNSAPPFMIRALLRSFVDPALVNDQALDIAVAKLMFSLKYLPGPAKNARDFIARLKTPEIQVGNFILPALEQTLTSLIATDSRVFRLEATGYVNDSTRTITTTVRINRNGVRYLEWKEL